MCYPAKIAASEFRRNWLFWRPYEWCQKLARTAFYLNFAPHISSDQADGRPRDKGVNKQTRRRLGCVETTLDLRKPVLKDAYYSR